MCICQQLCMGHERWYIHPTLGQGSHSREQDLQVIAACPIYLPQLPKMGGLIQILGQLAYPEVVNQRPILSHINHSPHGYYTLTGLTKSWPSIQMHAIRLSSLCGSSGYIGYKVSCRASHSPAHTIYMAGHLVAVWSIQAGQLHTHPGSATD